ncbi:kynurenine formamidase [Streptomyces griseochromogenes]|uniref:Kynurenine formamidase n=2 Tax=Streptomyces griseochromogenes TaxID=68214 RepID=A0ABS4LR00_9ACTN|nr:cyclase family protein [Streptomyces griseochromogenes]MBP2049822.1 kynurenine formamidase [Streptomyces griseochromogenes]
MRTSDAMSEADFRSLHRRLRDKAPGGRAGRGALETITGTQVLAAVREVRSGRAVSLAAPVNTRIAPDDADPAEHRLTAPASGHPRARGLDFARDRFAMNIHGDVDSHLDALCHVIYDGTLHGGLPAADVLSPDGADALSVDLARDGIVGRGVLLDIPRLHGVPWLEPGSHVTADDLAAAEAEQGLRVGRGDILLVRVGHRLRREELGPWDVSGARAGLHPGAMEFVAEREVSVLGSDGNNDTAPSAVREVGFPVHVLAVHAMGLPLLDYLRFEDLAPVCAREGRWTFLCVIAPLLLPSATGSPVNPLAIL